MDSNHIKPKRRYLTGTWVAIITTGPSLHNEWAMSNVPLFYRLLDDWRPLMAFDLCLMDVEANGITYEVPLWVNNPDPTHTYIVERLANWCPLAWLAIRLWEWRGKPGLYGKFKIIICRHR